jgi:hypothetical protein
MQHFWVVNSCHIMIGLASGTLNHYKISQFYRRINSVGVWLEVRRWFFYRRHHRWITSVGFPFVGDSPFRRISVGKTKKSFADGFTDGICAPKKIFSLEIYRRIFIPSVKLWLTDGNYPSVNPSVIVWNTDRIYPSVNLSLLVAATVKCRRINSVDKSVGECLKYRPNSSVGKILGNSFFLNFFLKNIKLYKLIVIQTNYANKIYIKHKKVK